MDQKEGIKLQEKTALNMKVFEQSKVLFFRRILEGKQAYATAAFLNDELIKLPMFPSKALEADFNLFPKLIDRELLTTDMLHKYSWCRMIWSLFSAMDSKSVSSWDISLFLNVVNGSFILHCEDLNMIRNCLAIYIKTARHFQHLFATNGYKYSKFIFKYSFNAYQINHKIPADYTVFNKSLFKYTNKSGSKKRY